MVGRLDINTGSVGNIGIGTLSLNANVSGGSNTAVGYQSLSTITNANGNTALGRNSMQLATGSFNTAVGNSSLSSTTGQLNTAVGTSAGVSNTSGINNTAIGADSMNNSTTSSNNVCVGYVAGTTIGTTSNTITCIGSTSDVSVDTWTNSSAIGYGAVVTASNTVQLGNASVTQLFLGSAGGGSIGSSTNPVKEIWLYSGGTASSLNYYRENLTFTSSFTVNGFTSISSPVKLIRIGSVVTLVCVNTNSVSGNNTSQNLVANNAIPTQFRPADNITTNVIVFTNGNYNTGYANISTAGIITMIPIYPNTLWNSTSSWNTWNVSYSVV